jgi:hypothetical protein
MPPSEFLACVQMASVRLAGQAVAGWCLREQLQLDPGGYLVSNELLGLGQSSAVVGPLEELAQAQVEVAQLRLGLAWQAQQAAGGRLYVLPLSHQYLGSMLPSTEEQLWLAATINNKLRQLRGAQE